MVWYWTLTRYRSVYGAGYRNGRIGLGTKQVAQVRTFDPARWNWLTDTIAMLFLILIVPFMLPLAIGEWTLEKFRRWKCTWGFHGKSPIINVSQVVVTSKKNKELQPLNGQWKIRKCQTCGEKYSRPEDQL